MPSYTTLGIYTSIGACNTLHLIKPSLKAPKRKLQGQSGSPFTSKLLALTNLVMSEAYNFAKVERVTLAWSAGPRVPYGEHACVIPLLRSFELLMSHGGWEGTANYTLADTTGQGEMYVLLEKLGLLFESIFWEMPPLDKKLVL